MKIKFTKEVTLSNDDIKTIIIKHLHQKHNLSGIFDIDFLVINKPTGSNSRDFHDHWVLDCAKVRISENNDTY